MVVPGPTQSLGPRAPLASPGAGPHTALPRQRPQEPSVRRQPASQTDGGTDRRRQAGGRLALNLSPHRPGFNKTASAAEEGTRSQHRASPGAEGPPRCIRALGPRETRVLSSSGRRRPLRHSERTWGDRNTHRPGPGLRLPRGLLHAQEKAPGWTDTHSRAPLPWESGRTPRGASNEDDSESQVEGAGRCVFGKH